MTRLSALPDPDTIRRLKGTLDFYSWKGIPVCRKWPRLDRAAPQPLEAAAASDFGNLAREFARIAPFVRLAAARRAVASAWTWRDYATAAVFHHVHRW